VKGLTDIFGSDLEDWFRSAWHSLDMDDMEEEKENTETYIEVREEVGEIFGYAGFGYEDCINRDYYYVSTLTPPKIPIRKHRKNKWNIRLGVQRRAYHYHKEDLRTHRKGTRFGTPRSFEGSLSRRTNPSIAPTSSGVRHRSTITPVTKLRPLDIIKTKKDIKVIVQMSYVDKKNIKLNAYDNVIEILVDRNNERYHRYIDLPPGADISSISSTYKNGILEMIFKRKTRARAVKTGQE
jgi:HSP20 family molecular chaperone IbpA